jgi:hypothetical protein
MEHNPAPCLPLPSLTSIHAWFFQSFAISILSPNLLNATESLTNRFYRLDVYSYTLTYKNRLWLNLARIWLSFGSLHPPVFALIMVCFFFTQPWHVRCLPLHPALLLRYSPALIVPQIKPPGQISFIQF